MTPIEKKIEHYFSKYPARTFERKDILVQAGSNPPGVFYITTGRVLQYDISPAGNTVIVNVFKPPAFFPMSWAINQGDNSYFFEAATKVVAHIAPAPDVVTFLQGNPDVLFDLLARVYRGTDGVLRRMAHLMGGSAKNRLIFELINSGLRFGEPLQGNEVLIALTESDLARQSGLARIGKSYTSRPKTKQHDYRCTKRYYHQKYS